MNSIINKRSNLNFLVILTLSFLLAILIFKFFRLVLTLPFILIGIAFLLSKKLCRKGLIRIFSINIGLIFSILGLLFTSINLFKILREIDKSASNKVKIISSGDYGVSGTWLKGENADGLGYKYPANLTNHTSKKIAKSENQEILIYDVIYNIDNLGNRKTPSPTKFNINKNQSVLFLGDSLTFGEGLNDNETLSFYFQSLTNRASLNAGMHGYGGHQALMILFNEDLFLKRTKGHEIKSIIYRPIVNHVNRAAGYSSWDSEGPCFENDENNNLKYKGSFISCKKRVSENTFKAKLISRLSSSKEPWTREFFHRFSPNSNFSSRKYQEKDFDRFVAIVIKMKNISQSKGINFYVLLEDFNKSRGDSCGSFIEYSDILKDKFISNSINLIQTSSIFNKNMCSKIPLSISKFDKHPSSNANLIIAEYLIRNNLIK